MRRHHGHGQGQVETFFFYLFFLILVFASFDLFINSFGIFRESSVVGLKRPRVEGR